MGLSTLYCEFCLNRAGGLLASRSAMYRCPNCGMVLCNRCVRKRISLWRTTLSVLCILLIPLTAFFSLIGVALFRFHGSHYCLRCKCRVLDIT